MYAITGISGKVGGALASALLASGQRVRAVVRDADKGKVWAERGCEVALATMQDATSLAAAFEGADGVFILPPSEFDPSPGFPEALTVIDAVKRALETASPPKVVCLSTVGAQASQPNLLTQRTLMEKVLGTLPKTCLVFGQRRLGCSTSTRQRPHPKFSAASRSVDPDGRDSGCGSGSLRTDRR
jgi:NAD(P)H dehydrogenase (quinone)